MRYLCSAPALVLRAAATTEAGSKLSANSSSPAKSPEDAIVFRPFEEVWCMAHEGFACATFIRYCLHVLASKLRCARPWPAASPPVRQVVLCWQVIPQLQAVDQVKHLSEAKPSFARVGYNEQCEAAINEQVGIMDRAVVPMCANPLT